MMSLEMYQKLHQSLITHESCRYYPYIDSVGKITIGIGYNLSDRGMTDDWINQQYKEDVNYFYTKLMEFDWLKIE